MKPFGVGNLQCRTTALPKTTKIVYIITPAEINEEEMMRLAVEANCNIAVIYDIDWHNMLSPWEAGTDPAEITNQVKGAAVFLLHLMTEAIPTIEKALGYTQTPTRTLIGVELAGLFALWSMAQTDCFDNVCCLSGPLAFPTFVEWFEGQNLSQFKGKAFISSGDDEDGRTPQHIAVADKLQSSRIAAKLVEHDNAPALEGRVAHAIEWIMETA